MNLCKDCIFRKNNLHITITFWLCLLSQLTFSQVSNDDIENRIELIIDAPPAFSNTTDCTVQWNCVDQSLTGKCIQYHNDQWFWFKTQDITRYYINISGQTCRDLRGVQLVVIDGTPCETDTYQILNCTSLSTQDDIFVALDSLKPYHTYLINVDGYLNDNCRFNIQASTTPQGLPLEFIEDAVEVNSYTDSTRIILDWQTPESISDQLITYEIFRQYEDDKKFYFSKEVPHQKNAFGVSNLNYQATDTVPDFGTYHYKIVGITNENRRLLLGAHTVSVYSRLPTMVNNILTLAIPCQKDEAITVSLYNPITKKLLKTESIQCTKGDYIWKYNLNLHFSSASQFYKIIVEHPGGEIKEYLYQKE